MKLIGLMSGTSLDGLDLAYCDIEGYYLSTKEKLITNEEVKMPSVLKEKIQHACDIHGAHVDEICSLNFELGHWFGNAVQAFMKKHGITDVDAVCSHGQTIYHIPHATDRFVSSTLQIGEPAVIAWLSGCQVISDFRKMDMAAGGEGAPLVPYVDFLLYRDASLNRILLNIGGISNITVLSAGCLEEQVQAFDTGPGNMLIDEAMRHYFHTEYDRNGNTGRGGQLIIPLLEELKKHPYVDALPPKSTGREMFGRQFADDLFRRYEKENGEDMVCTLTHFTAYCNARNIHRYAEKDGLVDQLIVSGGGSHNSFLRELLLEYLGHGTVLTQEDLGFNSDAKEAVAFAVLGNETLHSHYANMKSATGASKSVILGNITPKVIHKTTEEME